MTFDSTPADPARSGSPDAALAVQRCRRLGATTMILAAGLAVLLVTAGLLIGGALGAIALSTGLTGAGMALLSGLVLRNAVAHGPDPARYRAVRRALVFLCVAAAFCYLGLLVAGLALGLGAAGFALLLLAALPILLTVLAAVTGHQNLRP